MTANHLKIGNADESDREYLIEMLLEQGNEWDIHSIFAAKLRSMFAKLPLNVLEKLEKIEPVFFAPGRVLGRVYDPHPKIDEDKPIVYFSADLLSLPEEHAEAVIGHELAHLYLGHREEFSRAASREAYEGELEADNLVESWGFTLPPERKEQLAQDDRSLTSGLDMNPRSSEPKS